MNIATANAVIIQYMICDMNVSIELSYYELDVCQGNFRGLCFRGGGVPSTVTTPFPIKLPWWGHACVCQRRL